MKQRGALATAPALAREGWPWGMGQRPMSGPRTTAGPAHGAQAAPGRATSWARLALAMRGEPPPFDKHGPGWPMRWRWQPRAPTAGPTPCTN